MGDENTFRSTFELAPVGMARVSLDGRWLEVNQRLCEITGYSREELLATTFLQVTSPDDVERGREALHSFIAGQIQTYSVEKTCVRKDGHIIWAKISTSLVRDSVTSEPRYFISVVEEITTYKLAQEALLKAEERWSKAFREIPSSMTISSAKDHRYLEVNDAFERLTGWRREEAVGHTPIELGIYVNPEDRLDLVRRLLAGEIIRDAEYRFRARDGRILTGLGSAELIDLDGEPCVLGVVLDITERKQVEEKWSKALRETPCAIAITRAQNHQYLEVNDFFETFTGYCREEVIGRTSFDIGVWVNPSERLDLVRRLLAGESIRNEEYRFRRKNGSICVALGSAELIELNGEPCVLGVALDITERKQAEEKWSKAFRETPTAIMITSAKDHRYLEVNEAFEHLSGWRREEVIGRTPFDLGIWADPSERLDLVKRLLAGESIRNKEYRFRTKDGGILIGLGSAELLELNGELCVLAVTLDITERKRMEEMLQEMGARLINAQEEERKRVSAELRDIIGQTVALLTIELAQLAKSARGKRVENLQKLYSNAQDVASDINILSQSLHPSTLEYVGLQRAIEDLSGEFSKLYGLEVTFRHEGVPPSLAPEIALCTYRIAQEGLQNVLLHSGTRQAWMELVGNAQDIRLTLWDKGIGFDASSVKTGVGLITMRERCRLLNGEFTIQSQAGTRIEVRIPLLSKAGDPCRN